MTPTEFYNAREKLGRRWGLGRPLSMSEMAKVCGLANAEAVRDRGAGRQPIHGPLAMLVTVYLAGALPPEEVRPC